VSDETVQACEARVRASFDMQGAMRLIGARLVRAVPGEVEIGLAYSPAITQQHGFVHGGMLVAALDSACGFAAYSLMPADAEPLTIELKHSFLAPGRGARFTMVGRVRKAGRTVSFCEGEAFAHAVDGARRLIATMSTTIMTVTGRASVRKQSGRASD